MIFVDFDDCLYLWNMPDEDRPNDILEWLLNDNKLYEKNGHINQGLVSKIKSIRNGNEEVFLLSHVPSSIELDIKRNFLKSFKAVDELFTEYIGIPKGWSKADFIKSFCNAKKCSAENATMIDNNETLLKDCLQYGIKTIRI